LAGRGVHSRDGGTRPEDQHHDEQSPHLVEDPLGFSGGQASALLLLSIVEGLSGSTGIANYN